MVFLKLVFIYAFVVVVFGHLGELAIVSKPEGKKRLSLRKEHKMCLALVWEKLFS